MVKRTSKDDPLNLGNVSKRFNLSSNRAKGNIAKTVLHLIKQCRDMIVKRFVKMEILLFRNVIFSETKLVYLQLTRSKRVKHN
jgi:hypothetical protein